MYPIHKHPLNSLNINITTHLIQQMGRNTVNCLKLTGMHGSVCVYVCNSSFKGQNVYSICNLFLSLFTGIGQNWVKLLYFLQNYLSHIYLCILQ